MKFTETKINFVIYNVKIYNKLVKFDVKQTFDKFKKKSKLFCKILRKVTK